MVVAYDQVPGLPDLAGVGVKVGHPAAVSIPTIPGLPVIVPTRLTNLTGVSNATLVGRVKTGEPAIEVLLVVTGGTFPPGNLFAAHFDCPTGNTLDLSEFPCVVTSASDQYGNEVLQPGTIPCAVAALAAP